MTRKYTTIILLCLGVLAAAAVVWCGYNAGQTQVQENEILSTDGTGFAIEEIPHADPMIVGKWHNSANPQWYKVYYDDFDEEEQLFWGKEWDEADNVFEEDLRYHGNGWFRWNKTGNVLHEYATMDIRDVPIHHAYMIILSTPDTLVCCDRDYKQIELHFSRP